MAEESRRQHLKGIDVEPADIDKIEFKTTRVKEGYDQDEVDAFLDEVMLNWEAAEQGLAQAKRECERLKRELDALTEAYDVTAPIPTVSPAESATRILEFAQRTADDVMADAKAKADETVVTARNEAERLKNDARGVVYQLEQEVKQLAGKKKETQDYLRGYLRRALNDLEESGG